MADEQSFRTAVEQQQQQDPNATGSSVPLVIPGMPQKIPGGLPMMPPTDFTAHTPLSNPKLMGLLQSMTQGNPNAAAGAPTLGPQPGLTQGMPTQMQASPPQNLPGGGQSLPGYAVPGPSMPPSPPTPGITPPVTDKQMFGPKGQLWAGSNPHNLVNTIQHIVQHNKQKKSDEMSQQAAVLFTADAIRADADKTGRPFTREEQGNIDRANAIKPALANKLREEVTDMTSPSYRGLMQVQEKEKQRQAQIAAQQEAHAKMVNQLSQAFQHRMAGTSNEAAANLMNSGAKQADLQADAAKKQAEAAHTAGRTATERAKAITDARKEGVELRFDAQGNEVRRAIPRNELTPKEQDSLKLTESQITKNIALAQKAKVEKTGMTPYQQASIDLRQHAEKFRQEMVLRKQAFAEAHPKSPNMPASIADRMSKASLVESYIQRMQEIVQQNPDEFGVEGALLNRGKAILAKQNPAIVEFQDLADRAGITVTGMHLRSAPLSLQEMNKLRSLWINPDALNRRLQTALNAAHQISTGELWPEGVPRPSTVPPKGTTSAPASEGKAKLSPNNKSAADVAKELGGVVGTVPAR